jgi:hypothetical protein
MTHKQALAVLEAIFPYAKHDDSCGDLDAYNNEAVQTCGCGLDSAKEAAYAALDGIAARLSDLAGERKPDGYAYRYSDAWGSGRTVIEFSGGQERNGNKPIEAIPYYFAAPPTASAGVTEAANALCAKLREIHADSRYLSVWTLHQNHHGQYTGPKYVDELAVLEAALSAARGSRV